MTYTTHILVLGATGYIGGSVLSELLEKIKRGHLPNQATVSALVRRPEQAKRLAEAGVPGILFEDLDDVSVIRDAAMNHDIVIAAASMRHMGCARASIEGLGQRRRTTGREVHYIHASSSLILSDRPVTSERIDTTIHNDTIDIDDIFRFRSTYEKERDHTEPHSPVRKVNQLVVEMGGKENVKTVIIPAPLIYGSGLGLFNTRSGQLLTMTKLALKYKQAVVIGEGKGIWNYVHILDLSRLYMYFVKAIMKAPIRFIPTGKSGYYFCEIGS